MSVHQFPERSVELNGGGDGGSYEQRLRSVEGDVRELSAHMKHVATKAWVLGGVLGGMAVAATIAATIAAAMLRLFGGQ